MSSLERPSHGYEGYQNGGEIYDSNGNYHRGETPLTNTEEWLQQEYEKDIKEDYQKGIITIEEYMNRLSMVREDPLKYSAYKRQKDNEQFEKHEKKYHEIEEEYQTNITK